MRYQITQKEDNGKDKSNISVTGTDCNKIDILSDLFDSSDNIEANDDMPNDSIGVDTDTLINNDNESIISNDNVTIGFA